MSCVKKALNPAATAYLATLDALRHRHPKIASAILSELEAQRSSLKLIASENYSSLDVQIAMGNLLTDKYAEGHPGHRFYAGCEHIDTVESLAAETAKELFKADHAYVQPHSGSDANLVAFWSILIKRIEAPAVEKLQKKNVAALTPAEYAEIRALFAKQKLLGLALDCGGHLTHGSPVNVSSKMFEAISYRTDPKSHLIDYKEIETIAMRERPLILLAGYSAYPRLIDFSIMREIADRCGATLLVDMAHFAGLVAGGVMQGNYNPVPFADVITSTTHKTLRGPRGGLVLCTEEYRPFIEKGCPYVLGGPLPHMMAAKAIAFEEALSPEFSSYAHQVVRNAKALAERFCELGTPPLTGGTDNHILLLDVQKHFHMNGRKAEALLSSIHCTINRNTIPNDPNGPWYCSGIRLGTPALTTRGLKEDDMQMIAGIIHDVLKEKKSAESAREEVTELLSRFPLYPELGDAS